ncbi:hypothetical protein Halru_1262 [Halovivax ruber XH-70]|uniref:Uncharacterized protein n=1 Tax=Halovivax ruber (strain DSM 18193 / JCM 13892 / XH-70) TaxID=797302 RepID=L0ICD9_HALRX|nr:hypothetical protein [Halovivax ruber]AGB15876.1 hypothetical protein Halru_1262 [Halovivax ruber XH-70]
MNSSAETAKESTAFEDGPLTPNLLGAVFGLMDVVAFGAVGFFVFEDPFLGALAGLFVGTGVFLFLPLFVASSTVDGGLDGMESDADRHPFRGFHRLAAGFALSAGGLSYLSYLFVEQSLVPALPIGLLVAAVVYVSLSFLLPNAEL